MTASANELLYFYEIAHTLNLTRAAEKLNISQPSLSLAVKRLEKSIGTPLMLRHKRGITLTKAGKLLLTHTQELLHHWDTIKSKAQAVHHAIEGTVSLGCHLSVGLHSIPKFLPPLLNQYPKLEIKLQHGFTYNLIEKIAKFEIDVGILVNPMSQSDLIIRKLYDDYDTFWYAANKKHLLDSENTALLCDPDRSQTQFLLKKSKNAKIHYSRMITSNSLEMLAAMTASGCGIGILPARVAAAHLGKLIQVPAAPTYKDDICLVYRSENKTVGTIKAMVDAIISALTKK